MGIFTGPSAALKGLRLLTGNLKTLLPLALLPAGVAFLISIAGVWAAIAWGDDLFAMIWTEAPENSILYALWWLGGFLLRIISAIGVLLVTPWLVMLVGLPLCGPLAEKADELTGGMPADGTFVQDVLGALKSTAGMTALGLTGAIGFFLLGLIPGVAVITGPFVAFVWTPLFLCFDLYDPVLSRRRFGFRRKLRTLTGKPVTSVSVGLVAAGLLAIPVVNLIGLPIAVLGGVIAAREMEDAGTLPVE